MKRILITTLQAAISFALLWWIFHDPEKRDHMADALRHADLWWLLPGLGCLGGVVLLQTQRWYLLLRAVSVPIGWFRCLRLLLIGMFFNLFLLGATGGDVVKIFYAMREAGHDKAGAFLSIAFDRVIGLLALALVSAVVVVVQWHTLSHSPLAMGFVGMIGLILGGSVGVVAVAAIVAVLRLENRLPQNMPLRKAIVDLAVATQHYVKAPRTLVAAFLLSIPAHLLLFTTFYFAGRALLAKLSFMNILSVTPIVNVMTSLPISFSGVGARETFFQQLLGDLYGTPPALATLIGTGGYLMIVVWGLIGGLVYLTYRPSDGHTATLKEMSAAAQEVAEHPAP